MKRIKCLSSDVFYFDDENQPHREEGPASEFADRYVEWFWHGEWVQVKTQKQFERWKKLQAFK